MIRPAGKAFHDLELHYNGDLAGSWELLSCKDTAGIYTGATIRKGGIKARPAHVAPRGGSAVEAECLLIAEGTTVGGATHARVTLARRCAAGLLSQGGLPAVTRRSCALELEHARTPRAFDRAKRRRLEGDAGATERAPGKPPGLEALPASAESFAAWAEHVTIGGCAKKTRGAAPA